MTFQTIRKNSFNKISALLAKSVGVIRSGSVSRVDDACDSEYALSDTATAMEWLKANQKRARVNIEVDGANHTLRIGGLYHFETTFIVYFDKGHFEEESAWYFDRTSMSQTAPTIDLGAKPHLYLVQ